MTVPWVIQLFIPLLNTGIKCHIQSMKKSLTQTHLILRAFVISSDVCILKDNMTWY